MSYLAFHDCVSGCDGCINLNNPDNFGLEAATVPINKLYDDNNYASILTRADYWAMAGYVAVERGIAVANDNCQG